MTALCPLASLMASRRFCAFRELVAMYNLVMYAVIEPIMIIITIRAAMEAGGSCLAGRLLLPWQARRTAFPRPLRNVAGF